SHDDARFLLPTEVAGVPLLRRDRLLTAGGSLGRRLGDGVRIGVSLERLRRTSNHPGASYEGWRYGLTGDVAP
ncbi:MAG TPA: hypothetical protein VFO85_07620, partial [Vicinamibacteria bacterium]|nr:hypothetical protein [Vicinamibacteria bacterium]